VPDLDQLIQQCRATPDDDGPRLVWADAVGGERGELVIVQCLLARGDNRAALRRRERELVAAHGRAWSGLEDTADSCVFRRGFVEAVEVGEDRPLAEIFAVAPLMRSLALKVSDDGMHQLRASLLAPVTLDALDLMVGADVDGDELIAILASGQLALRGLALSGPSPWRSAPALCASGVLSSLERLQVSLRNLDAPTFTRILSAAPRLRALDLRGWDIPLPASAIPHSVIELAFYSFSDELATLEASAVAPRLERLDVHGHYGKLDLLTRFPRLRSLDVSACSQINGFPLLMQPSLHELATPYLEPGDQRQLVEALGPQLEFLQCPELAPELQARVAGDVITDHRTTVIWSRDLFHVDDPAASWFQGGYVAF
jgi:hypothetical protein